MNSKSSKNKKNNESNESNEIKQSHDNSMINYWIEVKLDFIETQVEEYVNKVIEASSNSSLTDK